MHRGSSCAKTKGSGNSIDLYRTVSTVDVSPVYHPIKCMVTGYAGAVVKALFWKHAETEEDKEIFYQESW
jgi:hypothetical protein